MKKQKTYGIVSYNYYGNFMLGENSLSEYTELSNRIYSSNSRTRL